MQHDHLALVKVARCKLRRLELCGTTGVFSDGSEVSEVRMCFIIMLSRMREGRCYSAPYDTLYHVGSRKNCVRPKARPRD